MSTEDSPWIAFILGIQPNSQPKNFTLMWRKRECTPPNPSVREALKNHLIDLERRCVALEKIIATEDPERAEEMLVRIEPPTVLEVELRPRTVFETFGTLMDRSFFPKID